MNEVNKTLYIPLYAKATITNKGIILRDDKAKEIWQKVAFDLKRASRSKWLMYFMAMRARVFDEWTKMRANADENAVILHIGAGLDSRVLRLHGVYNNWYDIDFPIVIEERRKYFEENDRYHMIGKDVTKYDFLDEISGDSAIVIMEGISMYLSLDKLSGLFKALERKFKTINVLMDVYTSFGTKMSKYKNPIKDVGVTHVYGIDHYNMPINNTSLRFIAEHSMTPQNLIDELKGFDKFVFGTMFAGNISKRAYKIYEYASKKKQTKRDVTSSDRKIKNANKSKKHLKRNKKK